jgi:hypothetical protein
LWARRLSLAIPLSLLGLPAASAAHTVDGRPTWWKAKAGADITVSIINEANTTTKALFVLLNPNLLWLLPCEVYTKGSARPVGS